VGSRTVCALPALAKGLLYDDDACEAAWELVADLDFGARLDLWRRARTDGLSDPEVLAKSRQLLTLARAGLERLDVRDSKGRTEARFLDSLELQVERGATPAGDALRHFRATSGPGGPGRSPGARRALVEHFLFAGELAGELA